MTDDGVVAVVIGRNEGARLGRCLESLRLGTEVVVYVDSGSSDGSISLARAKGADVVSLDLRQPFTAARARNAGCRRARELAPRAAFVQFVDGDCELQPGWLRVAAEHLRAHTGIAVVCGRRRERFPQASVYNRLCDIEWSLPPGPAKSCGGDAMMRLAAFAEVGGYRDSLIAGEEPELCVRLRARRWAIEVLDAEMTWHDAAMTRFKQWWLRSVRAGHAYAEGAHLHGAPPERHGVRELRRAMVWGLALPIAVLVGLAVGGPVAALLLLLYPLQFVRLGLAGSGSRQLRWLRAGFLVIGKFAEAQGALRFWRLKTLRRHGGLIEYK